MKTEIILLLRETAPWVSQSVSVLPKYGWVYNHLCNCSEPLGANHAAKSRKGTVGNRGRNTPTIARAKKK